MISMIVVNATSSYNTIMIMALLYQNVIQFNLDTDRVTKAATLF